MPGRNLRGILASDVYRGTRKPKGTFHPNSACLRRATAAGVDVHADVQALRIRPVVKDFAPCAVA